LKNGRKKRFFYSFFTAKISITVGTARNHYKIGHNKFRQKQKFANDPSFTFTASFCGQNKCSAKRVPRIENSTTQSGANSFSPPHFRLATNSNVAQWESVGPITPRSL
jgi:hypothetical protein